MRPPFWAALLFGVSLSAQTPPALAPETRDVLDHVSANSLRGNLSFLSSDLLEGRDTPSRGLDLAAEFIASQFRRAGLEPVGDDGYFQSARWRYLEPNVDSLDLSIDIAGQTWKLPHGQATISFLKPLRLDSLDAIKIKAEDPEAARALTVEQVEGKVLLVEMPPPAEGEQRQQAFRKFMQTVFRLDGLKPALIVGVERRTQRADLPRGRLLDGESKAPNEMFRSPLLLVYSEDLAGKLAALPAGPIDAKVTAHVAEPNERPVVLKNVAGLLRGSDPELKDTYILVTAHYDHIGMGPAGTGDHIFNGANDDGSGTVSVIELASALAGANPRPKRSILFMTVFGEERGLLGSRYYARHPLVPLARTIANINLEQVGRTDSPSGPLVASASFTGFAFSDLPKRFQEAGELTGVKVYSDPEGDSFFARSDNVSFANAGIPAHTMCVAYVYPDYHGVGDHWDKIDYDNMAKVDRMVAAGLLMIANDSATPKWDPENPKTARYRKEAAAGSH